jgi:hypothetical protein
MSGLEAKSVQALGVLHSLRSKKKLAAEKPRETHSSNKERNSNGLWIMLRDNPLGQESELKRQKQRFSKSRRICSMLKLRD